MADKDGVGLNKEQLTTSMSISLAFRPATDQHGVAVETVLQANKHTDLKCGVTEQHLAMQKLTNVVGARNKAYRPSKLGEARHVQQSLRSLRPWLIASHS